MVDLKKVTIITEGLSFKNPNGILTWIRSILSSIGNYSYDFSIINITSDIENAPEKNKNWKSLSMIFNIDPWSGRFKAFRFSDVECNYITFNDKVIDKIKKHLSIRVRENELAFEHFISPLFKIMEHFSLPVGNIIHAANPGLAALLAIAIKRTINIPIIISQHGDLLEEWKLRLINPYFLGEIRYPRELKEKNDDLNSSLNDVRNILRYTILQANVVLPVAKFHVKRNKQILGIKETKSIILRNGIPTQCYPMKDNPEEKEIRVGIVARINPVKGFENLIFAAKEIIDNNSNWIFNIYGPIDDYDYYDFLRSLVEDLNIENYFIFHRETWNANDALKEIDIFAMPSLIEGLPFSLIEATAMGIPSVVTNVGGISEVISNLGYYVPKNNSSALSKGIMRAKEEYTSGKYSRKKVLRQNYITNNFSVRNFSDELLRVYESLLYCF